MTALAGKHIVITRAPHQTAEMAAKLRDHGAVPILYPCIEIVPPEDPSALDAALRDAVSCAYHWLVLTSMNTVMILKQRLDLHRLVLPSSLQVAAIGPFTAAAAREQLGVEVRLVPEKYVAESLAEALHPEGGTYILLPQADIANPLLAQSLISSGAAVKAIDAYRTIRGSGGEDVPALLAARSVDCLTFTSPSTVTNFFARLLDEGGSPDNIEGVTIACIGPVTAEAAREIGLAVDVLAPKQTVESLISALIEHYQA